MIVQFMIGLTGLIALGLIMFTKQSHYQLIACIVGIIGQPFWMYTSLVNEQYGILILSVAYCLAWVVKAIDLVLALQGGSNG